MISNGNHYLWFYVRSTGVVGIKVPGNASPPCVVRYMESSLHATLSIMLTPCKSMEGGLAFLSHRPIVFNGLTRPTVLVWGTIQL